MFERCAIADIQRACDLMRPVWERSGGLDGYISLEVEADLAFEEERTVDRAHRLKGLVDRPNVMIKVPGTDDGVERLPPADARRRSASTSRCCSRSSATARSPRPTSTRIERARWPPARTLDPIDSVASFFVSRIDSKVDAKLPDGSPLAGKIAVANAKVAYADVYQVVFTGQRWERLEAAGANPQRPLWASTSTKNPAYPPTLYVDELIGPDTVNTVPDATLDAFREGGQPASARSTGTSTRRASSSPRWPRPASSLDEITSELEREGVKSFPEAYNGMIDAIAEKRGRVAAD